MSLSLSQNCVAKLYASVIEDVIGGVREFFMDEGVDEQVLMELKCAWEVKLKSSKAVEVPKPDPEPQPPHLKTQPPPSQQKPGKGASGQASSGTVYANNHSSKTLSVRLNNEERHFSIDVPISALSGNQLHNVLSGPVISATMALPANLATPLLQQHVIAALQGHASSMIPLQTPQIIQAVQNSVANGTAQTAAPNRVTPPPNSSSNTTQSQPFTQQGGVPQVDGVRDSSDEDDNDDEDNDDDEEDNEDDDKDEDEDEDPDAAEDAIEEEPLNSEDDVSEDDPSEMFETDNVVVCQYDKITRSRNKWKFYLKDGIMNLNGKDFVFQKSSGDAEW